MSMNPCPRCGGLMHCICHSTYKTTPPPALPSYSQRVSELENEIERLRARVAVLERACRLIQADPDPNAVVKCTACYRHSRLAYHALEAKP